MHNLINLLNTLPKFTLRLHDNVYSAQWVQFTDAGENIACTATGDSLPELLSRIDSDVNM